MAQLNEIFDANSVEPAVPLEALPPGKYLAHIIDSDMRSTKDGSGSFLWLAIEILDGPYTGRQTWDRLNLENPNLQAVEIAKRTLAALCRAVGLREISDSEELHHRPFIVSLRLRPAREEDGIVYEPSNEVRSYAALPEPTSPTHPSPARQAPPKPQTPRPPPPPAATARPWEKHKRSV